MHRVAADAPERLVSPSPGRAWRPRRPTRLEAWWAITAASFVSYIAGQMLSGGGGAWATLAAVGGVASCGWAWLFTRALFDPAEHDVRWPRVVALIVWLTGAAAILAGDGRGLVSAAADNAYALSGSAALLLTFVEPLQGFRRGLPRAERRFRVAFLILYSALVAVSILLLREPAAGSGLPDPAVVKALCATVSLVAAAAAVRYRLRHPLVLSRQAPPIREATAEERRLAERIESLLRDERLYAAPELKVADLAVRLGEPEYKVTRSITTASGFSNFNRLVNHHRIERARAMLTDPALGGRPILLIAFDCGFASVGPFNRAFKDATGVTPRVYRRAADG